MCNIIMVCERGRIAAIDVLIFFMYREQNICMKIISKDIWHN